MPLSHTQPTYQKPTLLKNSAESKNGACLSQNLLICKERLCSFSPGATKPKVMNVHESQNLSFVNSPRQQQHPWLGLSGMVCIGTEIRTHLPAKTWLLRDWGLFCLLQIKTKASSGWHQSRKWIDQASGTQRALNFLTHQHFGQFLFPYGLHLFGTVTASTASVWGIFSVLSLT